MKIRLLALIFIMSTFCGHAFCSGESRGVTINVGLTPAGSFTAQSSKIKGAVTKKGDGIIIDNIYVKNESLKTGMKLRDEHLLKRIGTENVTVLSGEGQNGNGKGKVKINGITKEFPFTYKFINKNFVKGEFTLQLSDFKIKDINYMGIGVEDKISISAVLNYKEE